MFTGIAGAALNSGCDVFSADCGHARFLRVRYCQPVAGQLVAPEVKIEEVAAGHAFGENGPRAGHILQQFFEAAADLLDFRRSGPKTLMPTECARPWTACRSGLLIGMVHALVTPGMRNVLIHLIDQFIPGDVLRDDAAQDQCSSANRAPMSNTTAF